MAKINLYGLLKRASRRMIITATAFGIVGIYASIAFNLAVFTPIAKAISDYSFIDFYYDVLSNTGQADSSHTTVIVDMTQLSTRRDLAKALTEVLECHPKVVGVDVVFEGLKEDSVGDNMIADVAAANHKLIFSYKLIDDSYDGTEYHETVRSFFAYTDSIEEGFTNMPRNLYGGMKRSLSIGKMLNGELQPSIIKRVADAYAEKEVAPLTNKDVRINFAPIEFRIIPADSIRDYAHVLADRVVLFGAMHEEADMHYTPQGKIAGVKLLAYGIETLLRQNEVSDPPRWLLWLVSFVMVLFTKYVFDIYGRCVSRIHSSLYRIVLLSKLARGLLKFVWIGVLMWGAFLIFCRYNIGFDLAWALTAVAFINTAEDLCDLAINYIEERKKQKQYKNNGN